MTETDSMSDRTKSRCRMILRTRVRSTLLAAALVGALAAVGAPVPAGAQASLERVEELARMGRTEEARVALVEWWDGDREDASRRDLQRGLWLRGRLTVDPVQAELDFRRLVVLYPSGQFTPDAILRLAQASWAMGNEESAKNYLAMLERDYPRSPARAAADAWMADAGPLPPSGDMPTPATRAGADVEREAEAGAAGAAAAQAPAARPPESEAAPTPASQADAGPPMNYFVQLGAFGEPERALALAQEAAEKGVDVRVVRVEGSRFTHVRVGRFADRAAAVELLEALTARGISAALVRDDRPETPIGN